MSDSDRGTPANDWTLIEDFFHRALARPASQRLDWLAMHATHPRIRAEVISLLDAVEAMDNLPGGPLPPSLFSPLPTDRFGGYELLHPLGRGGMGCVYLAHRADGQFEQKVALKVLASHLTGEELIRKFQNERRLLGSLTHAGIAQLHDSGVSALGAPYLVMEYVEGERLDRYSDARSLGVEKRLRLFLQICEALDYAHRNLIVHCDLKPANILVNTEGAVKLLDFGTASLIADDSPPTLAANRMLTPRYACPERLRGEPARPAHDVFSLGVILYELLTGAWPYGDPSSVIVELGRVMGELAPTPLTRAATEVAARSRSVPLDRLKRTVQGDLSAITIKAIDHNPEMRYGSVRELAEDLLAYLDGHTVRARPQTVVYRVRKFTRRHWVPVTAAAVLVATLSAAAIVVFREAHIAAEEARKAEKINQFLSTVLRSASDGVPDPKNFTVAQMLDAALPKLESSWKDDPDVEAALRIDLGSSYGTLFQMEKSKAQFQRALDIYRARNDQNGVASALNGLAHVAAAIGTSEEALRYLHASVDAFNQLGRSALPQGAVRAKLDLAEYLALTVDRNFEEALRLVEESLALCARNPAIPRTTEANAYFVRGAALAELGRLAEAEAAQLHALQILHEQDYDGLLEERALYGLVILNSRQHRMGKAAEYARKQHEVDLRRLGRNHPSTISSQFTMDRFRAEAGEPAAAANDALEALVTIRKSYPPLATALWNPLTNTTHCLNLAGRFVEAEPLAREEVAIMNQGSYRTADPRRGQSLFELGASLAGQKKFREARQAFENAALNYEGAGPGWLRRAKEIRARAAAMH